MAPELFTYTATVSTVTIQWLDLDKVFQQLTFTEFFSGAVQSVEVVVNLLRSSFLSAVSHRQICNLIAH